MDTTSLWQGTALKMACLPTLQTDVTVDVAVVGGGITGLSAAMRLAAGGKTVAVLERHRIGAGTTGHSTGNLYAPVDLHLQELARRHGIDTMHAVAQSRGAAVDAIERTVQALQLDCAFARRPWHLLATSGDAIETVERECGAAQAAGLDAKLVDAPLLPLPILRTLRVEGQAQFQPLDYVRQLAQRIVGDRCLIFENTPVTSVDDASGLVQAAQGMVRCGAVLLATHTPVGVHLVQSKLDVVREYGVALRLETEPPPAGIYWLIGDGCYSVRLHSQGGMHYLVVVGAAHPTGKADDTQRRYDELERYARANFQVGTVDYRWSAQRYRSPDQLPYIGQNPDSARTWIATGFSGDGLTYGTLAGMIVSDELLGNGNQWSSLYSPERLSSEKRPEGFEHESTCAAPPSPLGLDAAARARFDDLPTGQSRLLDDGGRKLAAYRCDDGRLLVVSAKCSHMGCELQWNDAETSWDCHCHGSRFRADGQVIEGPALYPLQHAQDLGAAGPDEPEETGAED
jgi:glycine/D-amino acid oxidase-like deaminating enzyme/nitrite reductase/ring-hydroxylating ferredoxin subunit